MACSPLLAYQLYPKARQKEKRGYHYVPIYLGYGDWWTTAYN